MNWNWPSTRRLSTAVLALALCSTAACSLTSGTGNGVPDQVEGIPDVVLDAYGQAAAATSEIAPDCTGMRWSILAGIGQEESKHGLYQDGMVTNSGLVSPPIIGVALNGDGVQAIPDTDGGRYDNDSAWDRAVGPMQFIPATWESWATRATGLDSPDPQNVFHSARAAAAYLCGRAEVDLTDPEVLKRRIRAYNDSSAYVEAVMASIERYDAMSVGSGVGVGGVPQGAGGVDAASIPAGPIQQCAEKTTPARATPLACAVRDAAIRTFPGTQWTKPGSAYCYRDDSGDHGVGRACDLMTSGIGTVGSKAQQAAGDQMALWLITNRKPFGIRYIIWRRSIWNPGWSECPASRPNRTDHWYNEVPDVAGGKWCGMEDRGGATVNHYDHVHISVTH